MELEMNERIAKLTEQCYEYNETMQGTWFNKTKFAELIVKDCMLICEDVMKKDNSALGCWSEIKRTFRS
jgi:hypothetical protein